MCFIHKQIIDYCAAINKQPRDLRVLDVGCGVGGITFPLASLSCIVVAFDLDEDKISQKYSYGELISKSRFIGSRGISDAKKRIRNFTSGRLPYTC